MESFKVYLPSNASHQLFPDNTPSKYRTRFDKPIDLNGEWEVGVESISYSSFINDEGERANVDLRVEAKHKVLLNNIHPYEFILTKDDKWKGFEGIRPTIFETDSTKLDEILYSLNAMNDDITKSGKQHKNVVDFASNRFIGLYKYHLDCLFHFGLNEKKQVVYLCNEPGFSLTITARMADVLGFGYTVVFSGVHPVTASHKRISGDDEKLTRENYHLRYLSSSVQVRRERIIFKDRKQTLEGKQESFLNTWNKIVRPRCDVRAEFKSGKLVLHNFSNTGVIFSPDMANTFSHHCPFIGTGSRWAVGYPDWEEEHIDELWSLDIYSVDMQLTNKVVFHNLSVYVYPWRWRSMKEVMSVINSKVRTAVKRKLKNRYHEKMHSFELESMKNNFSKFTRGRGLIPRFSKNLTHLLGLPDTTFEELQSFGVREMDTLANYSRQLHILSNVIKPTAYGKHQRQIFCDFLFKRSKELITETRFYPISFHPIIRNSIDMIEIQVTDEHYKPIQIKDSKTIVTLYFRKVK